MCNMEKTLKNNYMYITIYLLYYIFILYYSDTLGANIEDISIKYIYLFYIFECHYNYIVSSELDEFGD